MAAPIPTPVYHLTHIYNLASIIQSGGCLSFNQKQNQGIGHIDVAYETIQVRRAQTLVPCGSGGCLHDYVPFFFAPRPPMLYAIYGGHATMAFTEFFDDLKNLNEIDWEVMESRYWNDTPTLPDRKRRRQAEFLIKDCCPWELFSEIGVINSKMKSRVKRMLENSMHQPTVQIHRNWYL